MTNCRIDFDLITCSGSYFELMMPALQLRMLVLQNCERILSQGVDVYSLATARGSGLPRLNLKTDVHGAN
jgi:hypothetical protein